MDTVNKTLYIPLYGKAYVSEKGILLKDIKAKQIWDSIDFKLKGKSKSKWLAYYMAMRGRVYDDLLKKELKQDSIILHLGCGLDSRNERVNTPHLWYDIDFKEVIDERKHYYQETDTYHMIRGDLREKTWLEFIPKNQPVIVIMEGVSMYLSREELKDLFRNLNQCFSSITLFMDVYSEFAAKASKYKNPINDVGVTHVYGLDDPKVLDETGLMYIKEHEMTPSYLIDELQGFEQTLFKKLYAGKTAQKMYHLYEYRKG